MNVKRTNGHTTVLDEPRPKSSYRHQKKQVSCPNCGVRAVPEFKRLAGKLRGHCRACGTVVA